MLDFKGPLFDDYRKNLVRVLLHSNVANKEYFKINLAKQSRKSVSQNLCKIHNTKNHVENYAAVKWRTNALISLFPPDTLYHEELNAITAKLQLSVYEHNECIIACEENSKILWIIADGYASVAKRKVGAGRQQHEEIFVLGPGECFGDKSFLTSIAEDDINIYASGDLITFAINQSEFIHSLRDPEAIMNIMLRNYACKKFSKEIRTLNRILSLEGLYQNLTAYMQRQKSRTLALSVALHKLKLKNYPSEEFSQSVRDIYDEFIKETAIKDPHSPSASLKEALIVSDSSSRSRDNNDHLQLLSSATTTKKIKEKKEENICDTLKIPMLKITKNQKIKIEKQLDNPSVSIYKELEKAAKTIFEEKLLILYKRSHEFQSYLMNKFTLEGCRYHPIEGMSFPDEVLSRLLKEQESRKTRVTYNTNATFAYTNNGHSFKTLFNNRKAHNNNDINNYENSVILTPKSKTARRFIKLSMNGNSNNKKNCNSSRSVKAKRHSIPGHVNIALVSTAPSRISKETEHFDRKQFTEVIVKNSKSRCCSTM